MSRARLYPILLTPVLALAAALAVAAPARAANTLAPPGAPTISHLTAVSAVVQWTPSTSPGVNYYILETLVNGQWTGVTSTGQATPSLTSVFLNLQPATTYTYAVVAGDQNGNTSPLSQPTTFTTPPRDTALTCAVDFYPVTWSGGFLATVQIINTSSFVVNGWALRFRLPGDEQINPSLSYGATVTQAGPAVTAVNTQFNGRIDAYARTSVGLRGTFTGTFAEPSAYTVNGVACSVV